MPLKYFRNEEGGIETMPPDRLRIWSRLSRTDQFDGAPVPMTLLEPVPMTLLEPVPMTLFEPVPMTLLEPVPITLLEPVPMTLLEPVPITLLEPVPMTLLEPVPMTLLEPVPITLLDPVPMTLLEPVPMTLFVPVPMTLLEPVPMTLLEPVPMTLLEPVPMTLLEPVPITLLDPVPMTLLEPVPMTLFVPVPMTLLEPVPMTLLEPVPMTLLEPVPITLLEPVPITLLEPVPITLLEPVPMTLFEPVPMTLLEPDRDTDRTAATCGPATDTCGTRRAALTANAENCCSPVLRQSPQPPRSTGTVTVTSNPDQALIYVDGIVPGKGPPHGHPLPGQPCLPLSQPGYNDYTATIYVNGNTNQNLNAVMTPAVYGTVAVTSMPGASVYMDSTAQGTIPPSGTLTLYNVANGNRLFKITAGGDNDWLNSVYVQPNAVTPVYAVLSPVGYEPDTRPGNGRLQYRIHTPGC